MQVYRDADADLTVLNDAPVAVIGYGNQGQAHALNLRDSGAAVLIGQREGAGFERAVADGFSPMQIEPAVEKARLLILGLPDDAMPGVYAERIAPHLRSAQALGFIHGFNIVFDRVVVPASVDVIMVAPKGPGRLVRSEYVAGRGVAAVMAIQQNATREARRTALAWARGIGATRVGVLEATFREETITDLFGEQTVLCGGVMELMKSAFETLVEAGYPEELAYFECVHEVKQIVDLVYEGGVEMMRQRISTTARYGGLTSGPRIVNSQTLAEMRATLRDIEESGFARRFLADLQSGSAELRRLCDAEQHHPMARARRALFARLSGAKAS